MTKWLITKYGKGKTRWNFVEFGGPTGSESRGIVDILAIRKDHKSQGNGLKRGDCFEIVLIQTKGGSSPRPQGDDIKRLARVAKIYGAKAVVLAEWKRRESLVLHRLDRRKWCECKPIEVFR